MPQTGAKRLDRLRVTVDFLAETQGLGMILLAGRARRARRAGELIVQRLRDLALGDVLLAVLHENRQDWDPDGQL